nr:hypothetical protein [Angustibacter aerolatus]
MPEARAEAIDAALARPHLGDRLAARTRSLLDDLAAGDLAEVLMAGLRHDEPARPAAGAARGRGRGAVGTRGLRDRPAAQPALHPRLGGVDRRPGGGRQPHHAGPAPRDLADPGDLPAPPALRRHRAGVRAGPRAHRGRRLPAARPRRGGRRHRRADDAGRGRAALAPAAGAGPGAHRARRPDRPGAGDHAPRHRLHDGRRRRRGHVPEHRAHPAGPRDHRRRRRRARRRARPPVPRRGRRRHGHRRACASSTPASTR